MKENKIDQGASEKSELMRTIYDQTPYPAALAESRNEGNPLLDHWINSALGHYHPTLHPEAKIMVAGCGSGEEAIMLAKHYPSAQVVGLDFSEVSITKARSTAERLKLEKLTFDVVDLTDSSWVLKYSRFDFVLCHGVADYVDNVEALMKNLAACLAEKGILYMTVNSPYHPAKRIQHAFKGLDVSVDSLQKINSERELLKVVDKLIGPSSGIQGIGEASNSYLSVDIFPPIAHHLSIKKWTRVAQEVGLSFCGSLEALDGLRLLTDEQVRMLYKLDRSALSTWMIELRERSGMQMLFSRCKPSVSFFENMDAFKDWRPKLASCIGSLPHLAGDPAQPMHLTLQFPGLPDFIIRSSAYDLEVMRNCDGSRSIGEIINVIPVVGDLEKLRVCLFRAYHYGLLAG